MTHAMLDGISQLQFDAAVEELSLIKQRAQAQIDQSHAELESSWANAYTTKYVKTAVMGLVLTLASNPEDPEPVPVHCIDVVNDRHHLPEGVPPFILEAWKGVIEEDKTESPLAFLGMSQRSWIIHRLPLYEPTNVFHSTINEQLIREQLRFKEAMALIDDEFDRRDVLARQYNAAMMGSTMFEMEEDDDGGSAIHG